MSCRTALLTSSLPLFHVGVFASFTAPVNIDQFREQGMAWHNMAMVPCRVGHLGPPDTSNHNGSRRYGRARDMETQPNTRIPDTSLPFGGEGLVRLVRPPGAAFNPMSECGNQLDALSDTEKPATA
ncbi:uncharacterized protein CLUP02_12544 [Colletotrichum lupini]|uniref:Secreted protein n=1 Tax=Colletotrichum lupini TaxID=145971 RepID=A0A9Q8T0R9_9PEZI|nr:uncharacterized protein CLUP02_12544 [Colletotrichum lupini]UQC87042.1 hypothetical protein CLUP02_12544 [Colletotrichum lupini]